MSRNSTERQRERSDWIVRAEALGPTLSEYADASARAKTLAPASVSALENAGFFAMASPKEVGGYDVHPATQVEAFEELASVDVSSGWVAMIQAESPALAASDLGIAMGGAGTDVALETADIVLMSDDLGKLPFVLRLSRRAREIVRQNIYVSVAAILTLVVMTVLAPIVLPGFRLPLPVGVLGHEGSTLIVVANGLRMLIMRPE